ncbi:MAG: acetoacetate--CoA ligase, partial [Actinobacteria bacterium]|nr:acetoacetate--CoA ligase [Actinomycetota bacterium]
MQPVERTVLWSPTPERASASQITRFAELATQRYGVAEGDLHSWSVASPEHFWALVWEFCSVRGERGERVYIAPSDPTQPSTARFFPDATLSVAENLLPRSGTGEALVAIDEQGARRVRTWDELGSRVASLAGALRSQGVKSGDRVAAWLPNSIEAVEAMLAAASIGAVFSSASPDFGANGVVDRFGQI